MVGFPTDSAPSDTSAAAASGPVEIDHLATLHASGLITDDELAAGMRWRSDWLAYSAVSAQPSALRVEAGARCREIRDGIGQAGELLLLLMIVNGMSLEASGARLYPALDCVAATSMAQDNCVVILQSLANRYRGIDARQASAS